MKTHIEGLGTFRIERDMIDVSSLHRPDTSWRFVDAHGHEHCWHVDGKPAESYSPSAKHETPTLRWVFERWGYYEDGERYAIGHHECQQCGERIEPRYTADTTRQMIPGYTSYYVNDEPVTEEAFKARVEAARRLMESGG